MSQDSRLTVADVGEFGLIARLRQRFATGGIGVIRGIGDDTAAIQTHPGHLLLATTDATVEGVHFLRTTTTPRSLGRRALAVNLSDIAAMGGIPRWALVSLSLPAATTLAFVDDLASGLADEARQFGVAIVGGNLARSPDRLVLDLTLLGEVEPDRVLYRTGARAGDRLLVTGTLGDAAGGLAIVLGHVPAETSGADRLIRRQLVPMPRIDAGRAIALTGLATAMIDLSDGLASDLGHLATENQLGAIVYADAVPISPELRQLAQVAGRDPLDWALHGGEDYELLLTAPANSIGALIAAVRGVGVPLTEIGELTALPGLWLRQPDGQQVPLGSAAWGHFEEG